MGQREGRNKEKMGQREGRNKEKKSEKCDQIRIYHLMSQGLRGKITVCYLRKTG